MLLIATVIDVLTFGYLIAHPEEKVLFGKDQYFFLDTNIFSILTKHYVGLILVLTMRKLELSLKLLLGEISLDRMKHKECCGVGFAIVYAFVLLGNMVYFMITPYFELSIYSFITLTFLSNVLMITYIVVIVKLNLTLKKLDGKFANEKRSVKCQFFIILQAQIFGSVYTLLTYLFKTNSDPNLVSIIVTGIISALFLKIVPPFVLLLLHYKAFNPRTK